MSFETKQQVMRSKEQELKLRGLNGRLRSNLQIVKSRNLALRTLLIDIYNLVEEERWEELKTLMEQNNAESFGYIGLLTNDSTLNLEVGIDEESAE